jgi:integrase
LPSDVGAALAGHLAKREQGSDERSVFLRRRAPRGGVSVSGIQRIVNASLVRAGLPAGNCHRLRHTAATQIRFVGRICG